MLLAAINASPRENARRMKAMRRQVMENDIELWAGNFLRELNAVRDPHAKNPRPV
jgi:trehalose 6-phosphate synthase